MIIKNSFKNILTKGLIASLSFVLVFNSFFYTESIIVRAQNNQDNEMPQGDANEINDGLFGDNANNNVPDPGTGAEYPFDDNGNYTGVDNPNTSGGSFRPNDGSAVPYQTTPSPVPYREYQNNALTSEPQSPGGAFFECSATSILANALSTLITNAIAQVFGTIFNQEVPVVDSKVRFKEAGFYLFGFIPLVPSWDSFAYCLANKTIAYIADATIHWIRGGFEGNPAFVEDPERFFRQVADLEYGNFLEGVAAEMACDPFRVQIINILSSSHNRTFADYGKCRLYDGGGNVDGFLSGASFDYDIWYRYTQTPANNPIGSAILLKGEMERRISVSQNNIAIELDWGNGFLPWKDMEGNTVSPGNIIESQLETKLGIDSNRLALADEFDEVINELVNYLVKFALDETLGLIEGE